MLTQITDHTYAMQQDLNLAPWGLRISNNDLEKLRAGFEPRNKDDKWRIHVSAPEQPLSIHIAPTGVGVDFYMLYVIVKPVDDSSGSRSSCAEIASIIWETNQSGIRITDMLQAKKEVVTIFREILECDLDALPEVYVEDTWEHDPADISAHIYASCAPKHIK